MNLEIRKKIYIKEPIKCLIIPGSGEGRELYVDPENALVGSGEVWLPHLG
jgi:hypothetical protein